MLFRSRRSDIFMKRTNVPAEAGFINAAWSNYGKVDNSGVDMSLNFRRRFGKDWEVSALANLTYAHNKIVEIDEADAVKGTYRSKTGKPVSQLFGLVAERLFTKDDFEADGKLKQGIATQRYSAKSSLRPGDIKYCDLNNDGEINDLDQTAIGGTIDPQLVYGFGATVRYKMFDFGLFFSGVGKMHRILGGETWLPGSSIGAGNIWSNIDSRWTEANPRQDVFWPRMSTTTYKNNEQPSTWWLKDMSFLRLKNIDYEIGRASCRERV